MSRRHGKSGHALAGKADSEMLGRLVERLIEKHQYKEALKQAKVGFRQDGCPQNRRLLERTSYLRAAELAGRGLPAEAKDVAEQLLELGVTDSGVLENLVLFLPRVGLGERAAVLRAQLDSPEAQAALSVKLVDRAVLQPAATPASAPELHEGPLRSWDWTLRGACWSAERPAINSCWLPSGPSVRSSGRWART